MCLTGQADDAFKRTDKVSVHMCVCLVCSWSPFVKSLSETMCGACMRVKFTPMRHCCPLQPHPPLSPRDDEADSDWWLCPALPSPPFIPCSCAPLLSGPHLLPLAFNAELGSPLIKVKASQCLDETERVRESERESVGEGLKETDEKLLYLCMINLLWNADELVSSFYMSGTDLSLCFQFCYFTAQAPAFIWNCEGSPH